MHPFKRRPMKTIPYGNLPRGQFVELNGVIRWDGELFWSSSHGNASALWVAGYMVEAYNVLLPNKERVEEVIPADLYGHLWRIKNEDGSYSVGKLKVYGSEISFQTTDEKITYRSWQGAGLPETILSSKSLKEAASDMAFAERLYGALCNIGWHNTKKHTAEILSSWAMAAELVAQLRDRNETVFDFIFSGSEEVIVDEVLNTMKEEGLEPIIPPAPERSHKEQALELLDEVEEEYPEKTPFWYTFYISRYSTGDDPQGRAHKAAFAGRMTIDEWWKFWELWNSETYSEE